MSVVILDLNGLKEANDQRGHDAGDALLRRLGEVLNEAVSGPNRAARIGGDEFALLMPGADEAAVAAMIESIDDLLKINNQFYPTGTLSVSMGRATSAVSESLEALVKRADIDMYKQKQVYYSQAAANRRR